MTTKRNYVSNENHDELLKKASKELYESREQIVNDYIEAFTAANNPKSAEECAWLIKNIVINIELQRGDWMCWKVWCTFKERNECP